MRIFLFTNENKESCSVISWKLILTSACVDLNSTFFSSFFQFTLLQVIAKKFSQEQKLLRALVKKVTGDLLLEMVGLVRKAIRPKNECERDQKSLASKELRRNLFGI